MTTRKNNGLVVPIVMTICIMRLSSVNISFAEDTAMNQGLLDQLQGQSEQSDIAVSEDGNPIIANDASYNADWANRVFGGSEEPNRKRVAPPIFRCKCCQQSRPIRKIVGVAEPREDCIVFLTAGQYPQRSGNVAVRDSQSGGGDQTSIPKLLSLASNTRVR